MQLTLVLSIIVTLSQAHLTDIKIYGGNSTSIEDHPWLVSLWTINGPICSGFLISPRCILTSAQCGQSNPALLGAVIGSNSAIEDTTHAIVQVIVHPNFKFINGLPVHDIAIIFLENPITEEVKARPILLGELDDNVLAEKFVTLVGYGKSNKVQSSIIQELTLPLINNYQCEKYAGIPSNRNGLFCAGNLNSEEAEGPCFGDFGGPAEQNDQAVGIISFVGPSYCADPKYPTVFTKISYYKKWIEKYVNDLS